MIARKHIYMAPRAEMCAWEGGGGPPFPTTAPTAPTEGGRRDGDATAPSAHYVPWRCLLTVSDKGQELAFGDGVCEDDGL